MESHSSDSNNNIPIHKQQSHELIEASKTKQRHHLLTILTLCLGIYATKCIIAIESSPQGGLPAALMSQLASVVSGGKGSGSTKMNAHPLVQLDTGSKYYQIMIDDLVSNFKKTVTRVSDRSHSLTNVTSGGKPINVISNTDQTQRASLIDLHIDGLTNPKVQNVHVNKKNLKLHVSFLYRNIRVSGRCVSSTQSINGQKSSSSNKILLEAGGWNAAWSANLMSMVGRDSFDLNKVYTSHTQQRLTTNFKDCHQQLNDKLKEALMERIQNVIESRLLEVMELVIIRQDQQNSNPHPPIAGATRARRDSELKLDQNFSPRQSPFFDDYNEKTRTSKSRVLKRVKRQTPCSPGEELDDYVDQLFRFGSRIIRAMEPVTLPNTTIELPDYDLKIFLYEGKGTRAYKLKRVKPAWVFCNNDTISLGITVEVEEIQVAYKYRVISGYRLLFDGDLEARLTPRAQAQFSQAKQEEDSEEPVQQRVDRVRLFRLGKVHVVIRGLGNLTQSLSMMINSYLNDNQDDLQPTFRMAEGDAVRLINRMLANVNVPLLSVV